MSRGPVLKTTQTLLRSLQLTGAVVILAIYSYTLGALANRGLSTPTFVRAVEGIAGITVAYAIACLIANRFFAGRTFPSFINMILDVAFASAFIYVAVANRGGAGSCSGEVDTAFGKGDAADKVSDDDHGGFMALPKYGDACRLLAACLAVSILMIFMFIGSIATSLYLGRNHHREKRQTLSMSQEPLKDSASTSYPGSYPDDPFAPAVPDKKKGWLRSLFSRNHRHAATLVAPENVLPQHTQPQHLNGRPSFEQQQHYDGPRPPEQRFGAESDLGLANAGTTGSNNSTSRLHRFGTQGYQRVPAPPAPEPGLARYDSYPAQAVSPIDDGPAPFSNSFRQRQEQQQQHPHQQRPSPSYSDVGFRPSPTHQGHPAGPRSTATPSLTLLPVLTTPSASLPASTIYFPMGPYENLRPVSRDPRSARSQPQLQARPQGYEAPPANRYSDGVYNA
ncbi:unnamed protein product [Parascedosporium putredinis]|uniref:MARVEL domain-containing protein n=1 Tax=Parascedosporium putredinis TaxID=1442378 RepID=A0A9P1GUH8_9PEZI|nr:unnamed protein product [Parascedosporium putredinis]CAI7987320.1 unnamed protein product [Parascedosporium putredinis]